MTDLKYDEFTFSDIRSVANNMSLSATRISNHAKFLEVYYDLHHIFENSGNCEKAVLGRIKSWLHKYNNNLSSVPASMLIDETELDRLANYVRWYAHPTGKSKY